LESVNIQLNWASK